MRGQSCTFCGRVGVVELEMTARGGEVLTMLSCPACEQRKWLIDGEPAEVDAVLRSAADDSHFLVRPSSSRARGPAARPR